MRKMVIILASLMILSAACSKESNPVQKTDQTVAPSGMQSPATASGANSSPAATPPAQGNEPNKDAKPNAAQGNTSSAPVEVPKGAQEVPVASKQQYDKVDFGMTYEEVSKAMGQLGKLISESNDDSGVNSFQTYTYKTKDDGTLKVTFRNGKLSNKTESSK